MVTTVMGDEQRYVDDGVDDEHLCCAVKGLEKDSGDDLGRH